MAANAKEFRENDGRTAAEDNSLWARPGSELITSREAASILRVTKTTITVWAQKGFIRPVVKGSRGRNASLFKLDDVLRLQQPRISDDLINEKQIIEQFGLNTSTLRRWKESGGLIGVAKGPGKGQPKLYRLADVQRLYDDYAVTCVTSSEPQPEAEGLVTSYEAAAYLGMSREAIHHWKRKGWIKPAIAATKNGESDKYRLEELIEFASTRQARGEGDASVSDDAVLSKLQASRVIGVRKRTILDWLGAGLVKPIRRGKGSLYFRVGDLREVKRQLDSDGEDGEDVYFTHHRAYYSNMGDEAREIVHAMVASCKSEDESPEYIFADAIAAVMAALNCPLSCCVGLSRSERIEKLKDFNRVGFADPVVDRSYSTIYDMPAESLLLPYTADERREAEKRLQEEQRLMWLRMGKDYRVWARDYNERLRSIERVAR